MPLEMTLLRPRIVRWLQGRPFRPPMSAPADSTRSAPMRRLALMGLMLVAAIASCKDVTAPGGGRFARGLSWNAIFPPPLRDVGGTGSGVVNFDKVHVLLHHSDGSIALDTTIDFPSGADSLTVSLAVRLLNDAPSAGEPMSLDLGYVNATGDTVFKGGPIALTASPPPAGGGVNPPVQVPVAYTGPGASATAVVIAPRTQSVIAGAPFTFTAAANDASGTALAGTPIIWTSLDPTIATITAPTAGTGSALTVRGTARILAQLLTGAKDTVQLVVTLPAAQLVKPTTGSGDGQTGASGAALPQPIVVKVAASDGVGVVGAPVTFTVSTGGGSVSPSSGVTDANGLAQTAWTLGPSAGTQFLGVTSAALASSQLTYSASAFAAHTWTGAANNQWTNAANWFPAVVPAAGDSVVIPPTPTPPVLSANAAVRALVISTAQLSIAPGDTLTDNGVLDATTGAITGGGTVTLGGTGQVSGTIAGALNVKGSYKLGGTLGVAGNVTILAGNLTLNGKQMAVTGDFCTQGTGTFTMTNAADLLVINGAAKFNGGSTVGLLSSGKISVAGNLLVPGAASAFAPSGGDTVLFVGTSQPQTITVASPTMPTFQTFISANSLGVVINSPITIQGDVALGGPVSTGGNALTINGTLTDPALFLDASGGGLTLGNATTPLSASTFAIGYSPADTSLFTNVTFTGAAAALQAPLVVHGGVTISAGSLVVSGQPLYVIGTFSTTGSGTLAMNNAADSVLIQGVATFSGGAEAGLLTNGTLGILSQLLVSGPGQFAASGSHVTLFAGQPAPAVIEGCGLSCDFGLKAALGTSSAAPRTSAAMATRTIATHVKPTAAQLAARRAAGRVRAAGAKTQRAAMHAARAAISAKWPSRAASARAARAAGATARARVGASKPAGATRPALRPRSGTRRMALPHALTAAALQSRGGVRSAASFTLPGTLPVESDTVHVALADTTGNYFANVRVIGVVDWQTFAVVTQVVVDTTGYLIGNGHLTIADTLFVSGGGQVFPEAVELLGVLSDSGYFSPDTTIFSGATQTMPSVPFFGCTISFCSLDYYNVIVNSPSLNIIAEDGNEVDVYGSLFIVNSGQLRNGTPDPNCFGCEADYLYVEGALETHDNGTLRMNDPGNAFVYTEVDDSAYFAGGSSTGLLTQGEIDFYGNFRTGGASPTAYVATSPHLSYFDSFLVVGNGAPGLVITFANPGYAASHFGDLYVDTGDYYLAGNVFADGSLMGGCSDCTLVGIHAGTAGVGVTSKGASVNNVKFDGVTWDLQDGYQVFGASFIDFENQDPTKIQFSIERSDSLPIAQNESIFSNWTFGTAATTGLYLQVTQLPQDPLLDVLEVSFVNLTLVGGFAHESVIANGLVTPIIFGWNDGGGDNLLSTATDWIGGRLGVGGTSAGRAGTQNGGTSGPVTPLRALRF
jgi:hypothetical protein